MADLQRLGQALSGFGAGVAGRGAEFQRGLIDQREQERLGQVRRQDRLSELSDERKQAFALDFRDAGNLARAGFTDRALTKLNSRLQIGSLLPDFDPASTEFVKLLLESGQNDEALRFLDVVDQGAVDAGFIEARARPEIIPTSAISNQGQVVTRDPITNEMVTTDLSGFEAGTETREKLKNENGRWAFVDTGELVFPDLKVFEEEISDKDKFTQARDIRAEVFKENADFTKIASSWDRIAASAGEPSAAGDLALIFNYMKMLDPGSTVREGEFATAEQTAGVSTRVVAAYNKVINGERLAPTQRQDFFTQAQNIFNASSDRADLIKDEYAALALRVGIPREDVIIERGAPPDLRSVLNPQGAQAPAFVPISAEGSAEGERATNPATGETIVVRDGQWVIE